MHNTYPNPQETQGWGPPPPAANMYPPAPGYGGTQSWEQPAPGAYPAWGAPDSQPSYGSAPSYGTAPLREQPAAWGGNVSPTQGYTGGHSTAPAPWGGNTAPTNYGWSDNTAPGYSAAAGPGLTYAQQEVQTALRRGSAPGLAVEQQWGASPGTWEAAPVPTPNPTAERVQSFTKHDIAAFGGAFVRAAFGGVRVAGRNILRPGRQAFEDSWRYGVGGAAQLHALRAGAAGAAAYEQQFSTDPRAAEVLGKIDANLQAHYNELRQNR